MSNQQQQQQQGPPTMMGGPPPPFQPPVGFIPPPPMGLPFVPPPGAPGVFPPPTGFTGAPFVPPPMGFSPGMVPPPPTGMNMNAPPPPTGISSVVPPPMHTIPPPTTTTIASPPPQPTNTGYPQVSPQPVQMMGAPPVAPPVAVAPVTHVSPPPPQQYPPFNQPPQPIAHQVSPAPQQQGGYPGYTQGPPTNQQQQQFNQGPPTNQQQFQQGPPPQQYSPYNQGPPTNQQQFQQGPPTNQQQFNQGPPTNQQQQFQQGPPTSHPYGYPQPQGQQGQQGQYRGSPYQQQQPTQGYPQQQQGQQGQYPPQQGSYQTSTPQYSQQQQQLPNIGGLSLNNNLPPQAGMVQPQPQQGQNAQADNRINMSQVPNPATVLDQFKGFVWNSASGDMPPPSSVQQYLVDQQNSTPLFMRSTMYTIPESDDVLSASSLPLAIHITPLASTVPVIDHGVNGPVRCSRCHAYINPNAVFLNNGKFFACKLCDYENDVPQEYFSATLPNGQRTDFDQRPELKHGSYEFVTRPVVDPKADPKLAKDNIAPPPPAYIFIIEVSTHTISTGILFVIIDSIKKILNEMSDNIPNKIGIITYDTEVHFWSFKKTYSQPQMKVVAKNSVFVPVQDGFLIDYQESKHLVDYFFNNITNFFKYPAAPQREFAFGAAVQSASFALEKCGGRLFTFSTNMPKGQPGQVTKREAKNERTLVPGAAWNSFYKPLSMYCTTHHIVVDMFVLPCETCELPTTGQLVTATGGQIYYYPNFTSVVADQLRSDIVQAVTATYGYDCKIRVRCSRGLTVAGFHGNVQEEGSAGGEVTIAGITSEKSMTVVLKYDDKLKAKTKAYIQFAMMYRTMRGDLRVRVLNLRLNVETGFTSYFKDTDLDATLAYYARLAARDIITTGPSQVRTLSIERAVDVLAAYRKHCAADKSSTQLILPECFKLLPIYILSMMKTAPYRISTDINPDHRFAYMNLYASLPPSKIIPLIYPRAYPVHNLHGDLGLVNPQYNIVNLPHFVRLSTEIIQQDGVYVIEDGRNIYLWVQSMVNPSILQDLFNVDNINGLNSSKLYELYKSNISSENELHQKVENIIKEVIRLRGLCASKEIQIVPQNEYLNSVIRSQLYEDKGIDSVSYVDFLVQIHRQIQNKLSLKSDINPSELMLMSNTY
ncbi:putative transport protein [Cavenderia fasciculata]|uniref:Transport protein n=1 Tax=Cavenderia fasciculata TaxID=261658 RepID=F4QD73_CACFS|nr:putative transport protein [Cavenderia fasciculata]EGG14544.1 putative transport protein [Cavenderia fasciculata]|eukprot:XP_004366064.1 putative transport protein [Cavenderia fasciculata]